MDDELEHGAAPLPTGAADEPSLETLRVSYQRVCGERDRLRDARGYFARPLGPAPASAGISTALVATLASSLNGWFLALALLCLILLISVGIAYDNSPAYRHLYARATAGMNAIDEARLPPAQWYETMILRESAIIGETALKNTRRLPWQPVETLQDGLDSERTGLRLVQLLWTLVITSLALAVLTS
jgi:hypothetical protein